MSPIAGAVDRPADTRRVTAVVACGAPVTQHTVESLRVRPVQDFTILDQLFDATFIDPLVAARGRLGRLVERKLGSAWVVAWRTVREARRSRVIIAMGDDVGAPVAAIKALLWSRTPFVMICWHMQSKKARLLFGSLRLHRFVQLFLSQSAAQRDLMIREYRIPADKIRLLHCTVDHRFFHTAEDQEQHRQIASAGMAARDYKTLIDATRGLDVGVKIEANSAWFSEELNFSPDDVHERIELCNDGTTLGLREIYASSEIIVVPLQDVKHSAGDSAILEGMAMGKPVVASSIPLLGDYITDGESGYLVPPGDVAALRARIVALLDDPTLRERLGQAGRRTIEAHFTRDHFAQRMAEAVEHVTS